MRSLTTRYDSLGRVDKQTSHGNQTDDPNNTTDVKNQVVFTFNDLSYVTKTEQAHAGVVGAGTSSDRSPDRVARPTAGLPSHE